MSTVNPAATGQTQTQTQTNTASSASGTSQEMGEEFTSFIKLLTAQVQNQDPLEPMDSTQFVEQLATFSTLEQQVRGNESLESIATMIGDLQSMLASDWLGKTVAVESSWVPYSGDAVQFSTNLPEGADGAVLNVRNSDGETIWTQVLDTEKATHMWDGSLESGGTAAADSLYEFGIDAYSGDTYLGTTAPKVITTVTDVGNENGTMRIGTSSKLSADMNGVEKLSS